MDTFRNLRMHQIRLVAALTIVGLSIASLISVYYVQYRTVPARVEIGIRSTAAYSGLLGVPILLALSYRAWSRGGSSELSMWRRRAGLVSISIALLSWLMLALAFLAPAAPSDVQRTFRFDLVPTPLFSAALTMLVALALDGLSRMEGLAAALLLWAWLQSSLFF
jgi:hypothetical protein